MSKHLRKKTVVLRLENECLWENIHGGLLVDLYCQSTRSLFMGKDSQLSETVKTTKIFHLKSFALYSTYILFIPKFFHNEAM